MSRDYSTGAQTVTGAPVVIQQYADVMAINSSRTIPRQEVEMPCGHKQQLVIQHTKQLKQRFFSELENFCKIEVLELPTGDTEIRASFNAPYVVSEKIRRLQNRISDQQRFIAAQQAAHTKLNSSWHTLIWKATVLQSELRQPLYKLIYKRIKSNLKKWANKSRPGGEIFASVASLLLLPLAIIMGALVHEYSLVAASGVLALFEALKLGLEIRRGNRIYQ